MKVLIADIPPEGLQIDFSESIQSDSIISPVRARLKIDKTDTDVIVKGDVTTRVKLQCGRCLKEFTTSLSVPIDVAYRPVEDLKGEETHEVKTEELDMDFYSGEELELVDLLKEQIELNLPMKPLCDDLCKGICPGCGKDLNREQCDCSERDIDLRFEALKKFLKK